ncbi:MAG: hypothetical protein CVT64_11965 [Actinobacteria bacterium HGW-Actinobacteria-4]|nr:MAG: hypothetical protein CVT64_11965 [Actinobacteria bacterium HGW-Actinobacteria-4]
MTTTSLTHEVELWLRDLKVRKRREDLRELHRRIDQIANTATPGLCVRVIAGANQARDVVPPLSHEWRRLLAVAHVRVSTGNDPYAAREWHDALARLGDAV